MANWAGPVRYERNVERLGMVGNFNRCVDLAAGRWLLILHDDDYLLPGAIGAILGTLASVPERDQALLFGALVLNEDGCVLRRQEFRSAVVFRPASALKRVLSWSSFVRFPAIVVRRDAFAAVGPFDPELDGPCDFDMWIRLFSRFGVRCVPVTTCVYSVHHDALTTAMFDEPTVTTLMRIFDRAAANGALPVRLVRRCEADWFHQFVIAGTYREVRRGEIAEARRILRLFDLDAIRKLGVSRRWLPMRMAMKLLVKLPPAFSTPLAKAGDQLFSSRGGGP
jgi:hypothetical protein